MGIPSPQQAEGQAVSLVMHRLGSSLAVPSWTLSVQQQAEVSPAPWKVSSQLPKYVLKVCGALLEPGELWLHVRVMAWKDLCWEAPAALLC